MPVSISMQKSQSIVERSRFFINAVGFDGSKEVLADLLGGDGEDIASHTLVASQIESVARLSLKQAHDGIDSFALIREILKFQFHCGPIVLCPGLASLI